MIEGVVADSDVEAEDEGATLLLREKSPYRDLFTPRPSPNEDTINGKWLLVGTLMLFIVCPFTPYLHSTFFLTSIFIIFWGIEPINRCLRSCFTCSGPCSVLCSIVMIYVILRVLQTVEVVIYHGLSADVSSAPDMQSQSATCMPMNKPISTNKLGLASHTFFDVPQETYAIVAAILQNFLRQGFNAFLDGESAIGAYRHHAVIPPAASPADNAITIGVFASFVQINEVLRLVTVGHLDWNPNITHHQQPHPMFQLVWRNSEGFGRSRLNVVQYSHGGRSVTQPWGLGITFQWPLFRVLVPEALLGRPVCPDWQFSVSTQLFGNYLMPTLGQCCLDFKYRWQGNSQWQGLGAAAFHLLPFGPLLYDYACDEKKYVWRLNDGNGPISYDRFATHPYPLVHTDSNPKLKEKRQTRIEDLVAGNMVVERASTIHSVQWLSTRCVHIMH